MSMENPFKSKPEAAAATQIRRSAERTEVSADLSHATNVLERNIAAIHTLVSKDAPVAKHLDKTIKQLFPKENFHVHVIDDKEGVEAFSLANGSIYVSRGLLDFVESEGELRFVLGHEGVHTQHQHLEEVRDLDRAIQGRGAVSSVLTSLGMQRYHEYEADVRGVLAAAGTPLRLDAVRRLLMRFSELERSGDPGLVHGSAIERIINIGAVARLKDLASHGATEAMLAEEIQAFLKTEPPEQKKDLLALALLDKKWAPENMSLGELGILLSRLKHSPSWAESQALDAYEKPKPLRERFKTRFGDLVKDVRKRIRAEQNDPEVAFLEERWFWQGLAGFTPEELADHKELEELVTFPELSKEAWNEVTKRLITDPSWHPLHEEVIPDVFQATCVQRIESEEFDTETGFETDAYADEMAERALTLSASLPDPEERKSSMQKILLIAFEQGLLSLDPNGLSFSAHVDQLREQLSRSLPKEDRDAFTIDLYLAFEEHMSDRLEEQALIEFRDRFFSGSPFIQAMFSASDLAVSKENVVFVSETTEYPRARIQGADHNEYKKRRKIILQELFKKLDLRVDTEDEVLFLIRSLETIENKLRQYFEREDRPKGTRKKKDTQTDRSITNRVTQVLFVVEMLRKECADYAFSQFKSAPDRGINFFNKVRRIQNYQSTLLLDDVVTSLSDDGDMDPKELDGLFELYLIIDGTHPELPKSAEGKPELAPLMAPTDFEGRNLLVMTMYNAFEGRVRKLLKNGMNEEVLSEMRRFGAYFLETNGSLPLANSLQPDDDAITPPSSAELCLEALQQIPFDPENAADQRELLMLSHFVPNPIIRMTWQKQLIASIVKQLPDGSSRLRFCLEEPTAKRAANMEVLDEIIEEDLSRPDELLSAQEQILSHFESEPDEQALGTLAAFSAIPFRNKADALKGLMEFHEAPAQVLKMFARISLATPLTRYGEYAHIPVKVFAEGLLRAEVRMTQFSTIDEWSKYAILRNVLVGKNGMYLEPSRRQSALLMLLDQTTEPADAEEREWQTRVKAAAKIVAEVIEPDQLFLATTPLLQKRALGRPPSEIDWSAFLKIVLSDDVSRQRSILKAIKTQRGSKAKTGKSESPDIRLEREIQTKYLRAEASDEKHAERWTVEQLLVEIARNLGTPGTRFLQILGQYADLPPRLQSALQDVYDKVPGQSKLTAISTTLREWPSGEKEIRSFTRRVGGGSIFSTYQTETAGGTEVVKVLAPNAEVQNTIAFDVLTELVDRLSRDDPKAYDTLPALIDDLREWIETDIHDPDFLKLDARFRKEHDGFTAAGHAFTVRVPATYDIGGKDSPYVKREAFAEGVTWNRWDAPETEQKDAASLLVKSLFKQYENGQVHSDVHPGNFILTERQELVIIDRHRYIVITEEERDIIQALFMTVMSGSSESLVRLLDKEVQPGAPLTRRIDAQLKGAGAGGTEAAATLLRALQKEKLRLPINVTLMGKNLLALNRMCKRAGFGDLQEAMAYQPTDT